MWRTQSSHQKFETEYFNDAIARVERDEHLLKHADAILNGAGAIEPLIAENFETPQDVRFHAEGPFVRDHLRLMLCVLFAIQEDKLHLIDIEEFRRMKGFEGEIDELEETMKEEAAFFEAFVLYHDCAKRVTATFTSLPSFRGGELGFVANGSHHFDELSHERAKKQQEYLELYNAFAGANTGVPANEIQVKFYLEYGIQVHYPHHGRKTHAAVFQALLDRICFAHGLTSRERDLLDDITSHHLEFSRDFKIIRPASVRRYAHLALKRGYDADDFIDLIQACMFLDGVCGSKRFIDGKYWYDITLIVNALKSEHEYAPWMRTEAETRRIEKERQTRNRIFREVGLDGRTLMDLLGMDPGPKFGQALREIQNAVVGEGEMPKFGKRIDVEIGERVGKFYEKMFKKGE
jgi:hypothetical protein